MNTRTWQPADGEAEAWMARLMAPDCTPADRAAFEEWLTQSPRNIEAWLEMERVQALSAQLRSDEMLRAATRAIRRAPARPFNAWLPAAAAAVLVVAVAAIWWRYEPRTAAVAQQYATAMGEQSEVTLADGTVVLLDTGTQLTATFDSRERLVVLERGRAQFVVGHDAQRPFLVKAGAGTIRDIGTTFQVAHRNDAVDVGLLEGRVDVTARNGGGVATLSPGEKVSVDASGRLGAKAPLDLVSARAWPQGDLVFKQRRLDELLTEMNRYSKQQVRLADPSMGGLTVSGVFHAGDQDALVAVLERGWSLRAERRGADEIVLHRRVAER
ncbi:FecR family protein [Lysobacter auxotrophicus]|uniref:FecR domain-containing protein n=1 Tax=Lysobacter auxotrophicus TaxID=2992573 RepID=A0ABM8DBK0_9GAMM|nr:FecR domain-containing protein [Lysobacter auxotrophicus]BDU15968.1 FecR domain-containing protein [Lysobacter auxotrophicus]